MKEMSLEEAIKILEKYRIKLLQTCSEIEMLEDCRNQKVIKQYNRCEKRAKAIKIVLNELKNVKGANYVEKNKSNDKSTNEK